MDLQYGIAVTNKFSLFIDEDEDPLEILRQKEEEAKNSKKDDKKNKSKTAKKAASADSKPKQIEPQVIKRDEKTVPPRPVERGGGRGGGRGRELRENDGSRPLRRQGPRENRDGFKGDENVPPEFRERGDGANRRERGEGGFDRERGSRGGGRGGRGGRGRGGGRGGPRPESSRGGFGFSGERRREFDRHSGTDRTGVKPIDKRDGSGAHNWGSYRDDVEDQTQTPNPADESGEWAPAPVEQPETADLNESSEAVPPKEEEDPKEMTLDEWKALQDQKRMKASFNIRKAGEGVDNNQWKKGIVYKKKNEQEDEDESEEEEEEEDRHGHRKQLVTDIRITFADNPRRGGRGGRGGRGRGGPRGEGRGGPRGRGGFGGPDRADHSRSSRESAPRMDDETDFPRLVKSEA